MVIIVCISQITAIEIIIVKETPDYFITPGGAV